MEDLRYQRYEALMKEGLSPEDARDEATAFMFSLRFKYHGDKQSAHGKKLSAALAATLGGMRQADSANGEIDTDPPNDSTDEQGSAA
ncbi:MAG: hypothetical protein AAF709_06745 [Pseudomonadota bacterium]